MNKKVFFFLFISYLSNRTICIDTTDITFTENINLFSEKCDSIAVDCFIDQSVSHAMHENISTILKALQVGGQIKIREKPFTENDYKKIKNKKNDSTFFSLVFFQSHSRLSWKLYGFGEFGCIDGKEYKNEKPHALVKAICHDIWLALMGGPTPFDAQLAYVKKTKNQNKVFFEICIMSPLTADNEKIVLRSSRPIVDLVGVDSTYGPSLIYSEMTQHNVRMLKLTNQGVIVPVIDLMGTAGGFTSSFDLETTFYVRSGVIYRYEYDMKNRRINHIPFIALKSPCASPIIGTRGNLFYACGHTIYCCTYDPISYKILSHEAVSDPKSYSVAPSFCNETKTLVYTQRIGKYMQLVSYDRETKITSILTHSPYDKQDPAYSPCGNYIAYIARHDKKCNQIELLNIFTKKTVSITNKINDCCYPCWITQV